MQFRGNFGVYESRNQEATLAIALRFESRQIRRTIAENDGGGRRPGESIAFRRWTNHCVCIRSIRKTEYLAERRGERQRNAISELTASSALSVDQSIRPPRRLFSL